MISFDFEKEIDVMYNALVTKFANSLTVIVKKIGIEVKTMISEGALGYGTLTEPATKKDLPALYVESR